MRVGIVTVWSERGAGYVSRQYRDALQQQGDEVYIYARGGESYPLGNPVWDTPQVTWGKKIPIHMPMAMDLDDFRAWLVRNGIEVVLFNEQQWWDPVLLCVDLGIKTGAYVDYYTADTVPLFGMYDFLICNTKRHYSVFDWHPQAVFIPWGTDLELYQPSGSDLIKDKTITFFHSAGVSPERKGTDLVLQAFSHITESAHLVIHTQVDLRERYPQLSDLIQELEQDQRLTCIRKTVGAPGLYSLGDVYVYPSRLDGIGLTVAEALSCGLPVIVPDNAPMNEFAPMEFCQRVPVVRFFERGDHYYWPECEVGVASLTAAMEYYVKSIDAVGGYKQAARAYAELRLNWFNNAAGLSGMLKSFTVLDMVGRIDVRKAAQVYEHARSNIRTKAYRAYPILFKPFQWLWPFIRRVYVHERI